jgi:NAD-dependent SIR2 family protein deacetylase
MQVVMIVGNGFNQLVKNVVESSIEISNEGAGICVIQPRHDVGLSLQSDIVTIGKKPKSNSDLVKEIEDLSNLWLEFDEVLKEIKGDKLNDEEAISYVTSMIAFLSNERIFKKIFSEEQIIQAKFLLETVLYEKLIKICEKFRTQHNEGFHKDMKKEFSSFGSKFNAFLNAKKQNKTSIYTTNYDGILDTISTGSPYGYITEDGFRDREFKEDTINDAPYFLAHLHGSYLFEKDCGITKKKGNACKNNYPVMVFGSPKLKESVIKNDNVLNAYFQKLKSDLKTCDRLIILGNSMNSEPHIIDAIEKHFNKKGNIFICSRNAKSTAKIKLQIKGSFSIEEEFTENIKTQEAFLDFFKKIFSEELK